MLILRRRVGECIRIGDEVAVTVVKVGKESVRIGVSAPDHVRVWRGEIEIEPRQDRVERQAREG